MRIKVIPILLLFLISAPMVDAAVAPAEAIRAFKNEELPKYTDWFTNAELTGRASLRLYANESFSELEEQYQQSIISEIMPSWAQCLGTKQYIRKSLIEVSEPIGGSLWTYTNSAELVERWKTAEPPTKLATTEQRGPWFLFVGGIMSMTDNDFGISGNFRIGSFLFKNRIDTSLNLNVNYAWIYYVSDELNVTWGVMARYHVPVSEKIRWNIGGVVNSDSVSGVTGIGIRFPSGIFDISVSLSETPGILAGWNTFF